MKTNLNAVLAILETLTKLSEAELDLDMAFTIDDYARELFKHKEFFEKQKNQLLEKYGEIDGDKRFITEDSPQWSKFTKPYKELIEFEIEINLLDISENDLRNIKNIKLKLKDVSTIRTILK